MSTHSLPTLLDTSGLIFGCFHYYRLTVESSGMESFGKRNQAPQNLRGNIVLLLLLVLIE